MDNLTSPDKIRQLMKKYDFRISKKLGQNFIINPDICPRIAALGGGSRSVGALEIGPGIGVLTNELAKTCKKVVSIEVDKGLLPLLGETLAEHDNVKIIHGDVLGLELQELIAAEFAGMEVIVCANLPYYITSPIVMKLLEDRLPLRSITVMVQKEAAQRICAPMPSRQSGAITAAIAYYTRPRVLFEVAPGSFMPAPDVQSAVIRLDLHTAPPVAVRDENMLFRVIRASCALRRKTILICLCAGFSLDKPEMARRLEAAGVPPSARAEALRLEDFAAISNQMD